MSRFLTLVGFFLLMTQALVAQSQTLLFALDQPQSLTAYSGQGRLGAMDDQEIGLARRKESLSTILESRKLLSLQTMYSFHGDPEGRGDYTSPFLVGAVDALLVLHRERSLPARARLPFISVTRRTLPLFIGAKPRALTHGGVFRWLPNGDAQVFLTQVHLWQALGLFGSSVDLDALCQDSAGNLYFSLAVDEPAKSPIYDDGDLLFIAAADITYGVDGMVVALKPGSAWIIANEADLDGMVTQSGLAGSGGSKIQSVGNLSALEIDPQGGTFIPPAKPGLGPLPNLLFAGKDSSWSGAVCSTGNRIGQLEGVSLGSVTKTTGAHLGISSSQGGCATTGLAGLALCGLPPATFVLSEEHGGRFPSPSSSLDFRWAGGEGGRMAFLFLSLLDCGPGRFFTSFSVSGPGLAASTEVFLSGMILVFPLGLADPKGRGSTSIPLPPGFGGPLLMVGQALAFVEPSRFGLSLPLVLQWF